MLNASPEIVTARPITRGSVLNKRFQSRSLITAEFGEFDTSSVETSVRPRLARTPSSANNCTEVRTA
jgi:hypothetical protein